jgi:hypothetical protein
MEPRSSGVLGRFFTAELHPSPVTIQDRLLLHFTNLQENTGVNLLYRFNLFVLGMN